MDSGMRCWSFWSRSSLVLCLGLVACETESTCEEDPAAQVLETTVEVELPGDLLLAELATTATERDRGWRKRRCDREALVLVPDGGPAPLPVWGCDLVYPVDVAFVRDETVIAWHPGLEPCALPCSSCEQIGGADAVDFVLELPAGEHGVEVGDSVRLLQP